MGQISFPVLGVLFAVIEKLVIFSDQMERAAVSDVLTGLPNRRAFFERVAQGGFATGDAVVVLVDIDHFKRVNDGYGHQAGDACLVSVGRFLSDWAGGDGVLSRFGGEEFAVIFQGKPVQEVLQSARAVAQGQRFDVGDRMLAVTFSIGLESWDGEGSIDGAISRADEALYYCKRNGRSQAQLFDTLGSIPPEQGGGGNIHTLKIDRERPKDTDVWTHGKIH